jgi:ubiquinone/menaquinone biosynthesis C-methylase UbiE
MPQEEKKQLSKADRIREFFRARASANKYATSLDFHLREIEIEYISRHLAGSRRVLDVGCGNGYSTLCYAAQVNAEFVGIDFVPEMISGAQELSRQFRTNGKVTFHEGDVTELDFPSGTFDTVISQRCLLNLPSREKQWQAFSEISRVLKPGGLYLMMEGTLQGLERMNEMRAKFGLEPIHEADPKTNPFSMKFDEDELAGKLAQYFSRVEMVQRFGMYYFISRVIHPLLVAPEQPKYDAPINAVAQQICNQYPDFEGMGHVALWVIRK